MSRSVVLAPRVAPAGEAAVALHPATYSATRLAWVFGAFVVVTGGVAVVAEESGFRLLMASLAVLLLLGGVATLLLQHAVEAGRVRLDVRAPTLRFAGPRAVGVFSALTAMLGLVPGVLALGLPDAGAGDAGRTRFVLFALSAVALLCLAQQLWALRTPSGLELSERGIRGVRGSARLDLVWDDVEGFAVVASNGAKLEVRRRDAATPRRCSSSRAGSARTRISWRPSRSSTCGIRSSARRLRTGATPCASSRPRRADPGSRRRRRGCAMWAPSEY